MLSFRAHALVFTVVEGIHAQVGDFWLLKLEGLNNFRELRFIFEYNRARNILYFIFTLKQIILECSYLWQKYISSEKCFSSYFKARILQMFMPTCPEIASLKFYELLNLSQGNQNKTFSSPVYSNWVLKRINNDK